MRLTVLAGHGISTNILLNWLVDHGFDNVVVIVESKVSRREAIRNRIRRRGLLKTAGQIFFMALVFPILQRFSNGRRQQILDKFGLRSSAPVGAGVKYVETVNGPSTIALLRDSQPDLVVVNGTRIIKDRVLTSVKCPFVNMHAGITPLYRGVHGSYWALWNSDIENFGTTIHLVDTGVDTGMALARIRTAPERTDNFATYSLLQQAIALDDLGKIMRHFEAKEVPPPVTVLEGPSRQWYHPTLMQYVVGLFRGVK